MTVEPRVAIARILADLNLAAGSVRDRHTYNYYKLCEQEILADFNLAVVTTNFSAIRYDNSNLQNLALLGGGGGGGGGAITIKKFNNPCTKYS